MNNKKCIKIYNAINFNLQVYTFGNLYLYEKKHMHQELGKSKLTYKRMEGVKKFIHLEACDLMIRKSVSY